MRYRITVRLSQIWIDQAHIDFPVVLYPRVQKRSMRFKRKVAWEGNEKVVELVKTWLKMHHIDPDHFMVEKIN